MISHLANLFFGDYIRSQVERARLAAIEDAWASQFAAAGDGHEKPWAQRQQDLQDALDAWAVNPYARRIINLTTSHILGRGTTIACPDHPDIDAYVRAWWSDRRNQLGLEIYAWCDELIRAGELFLRLHTNRENGAQYVRAIPARWIDEIITDPGDYRRALSFHDTANDQTTPALEAQDDPFGPAMLHYAVNRPVGAIRSWGGDLDPVLPNLRRYTEWLKDRVRINAALGNWAWDMQASNEIRVGLLEEKYRGGVPSGAIFIHTPDESLNAVAPSVNAENARDDGIAIRQAIAAGGNVPPFMLGDEFATRAQAREAALPTLQFWTTRQALFAHMLQDLAQAAVTRAHDTRRWRRSPSQRSGGGRHNQSLPAQGDWRWQLTMADLTREDNLVLARAAQTIVNALAVMRDRGWIDDATAVIWAAKFAGESLSMPAIRKRLENPPSEEEIVADERRAGHE